MVVLNNTPSAMAWSNRGDSDLCCCGRRVSSVEDKKLSNFLHSYRNDRFFSGGAVVRDPISRVRITFEFVH